METASLFETSTWHRNQNILIYIDSEMQRSNLSNTRIRVKQDLK